MGQKVLLFYLQYLRCGQICRAAPEKKGAGKGFISAVCFGRQRRNVSGDVHLPSQDQALVFCGRNAAHSGLPGGTCNLSGALICFITNCYRRYVFSD